MRVKLFMKNDTLAKEWIRRAQSNLARAKIGKSSDMIVYEDLVFDCQQVAEKSLKGLLIASGIDFPKTHSIGLLIDILLNNKIIIPDYVDNADFLTEYAVITRYPGIYEEIIEGDYLLAIETAEKVLKWVDEQIDHIEEPEANGKTE